MLFRERRWELYLRASVAFCCSLVPAAALPC
jgi:hypothetical protein